jgi:hypothetical protein
VGGGGHLDVVLFNCDDGSGVDTLNLRRLGPCHEALTDSSAISMATAKTGMVPLVMTIIMLPITVILM